MRRAQRLRKLLDCGAIDVLDATAVAADGVMVMVRRLAQHERRLAVGIGALGYLALCTKAVEGAVDRGK